MSARRSDVSRLFEHYGLDPAPHLSTNHAEDPPQYATALAVAAACAKRNASGRVCDPVLRSALLRERLLRGETPRH